MKTAKIILADIKNPDGWMELAHEIGFEKFKEQHPDMDEDEISDKFYDEVVSKKFKYGDYGTIEIIVDENFNIVGGKIFDVKK